MYGTCNAGDQPDARDTIFCKLCKHDIFQSLCSLTGAEMGGASKSQLQDHYSLGSDGSFLSLGLHRGRMQQVTHSLLSRDNNRSRARRRSVQLFGIFDSVQRSSAACFIQGSARCLCLDQRGAVMLSIDLCWEHVCWLWC